MCDEHARPKLPDHPREEAMKLVVSANAPYRNVKDLLAAMAGDVCSSVLLNNTLQADALARYVTDADASGRMHLLLMQDLERSGHIDRAVERLPGDKEMEDRIGRGRGLTTSELAVLLAERELELVAVAPVLGRGDDRLQFKPVEMPDAPQRVRDLFDLDLQLALVRQYLPGGTGMVGDRLDALW